MNYEIMPEAFYIAVFNLEEQYLKKKDEEKLNGPQTESKKDKKTLENLINQNTLVAIPLNKFSESIPYIQKYINEYKPVKALNPKKSETKEVPDLGTYILGMFTPKNKQTYVLMSLPAYEKNYVIAHEQAHEDSFLWGRSQDEAFIDYLASLKVGYRPF